MHQHPLTLIILTLITGTNMTSTAIYTPLLQDQYCVYHTTYSGTLMPPNYIGSSSVDRVLNENYQGSVRSVRYKDIWKSELKLHPELFSTVIVSRHDTREDATWNELMIQKLFNVVNNDLFINMAYAAPNGFFGRDITPEESVAATKRRSEIYANKTQEQKDDIIVKRMTTIANKSPEQKAETSKRLSDAHNNKTQEQKTEIKNRELQTRDSKTQEYKDSIIKKRSDTYHNKSQDQKDSIISKRVESMTNRTPDQKAASAKKTADTWNNKTDEERAIICKKLSDAYHNRTPEEKATSKQKEIERRNNKTNVEKTEERIKRAESLDATRANRTDIQREEISKNLSDAYNARTPEQKAASKQKELATRARNKLNTIVV